MGRWSCRSPLRHFPRVLIAAPWQLSNNYSVTVSALPQALSYRIAKCDLERDRDGSIPRRCPPDPVFFQSICRPAAPAFQRRAFSIDKEQRWAVAAAAVTVSKRRDRDAVAHDPPALHNAADDVRSTAGTVAACSGVGVQPRPAQGSKSFISNSSASACQVIQ